LTFYIPSWFLEKFFKKNDLQRRLAFRQKVLFWEDYAGSYDKTLHEQNLLSIGEDRYLLNLAIRYFGADCRLQYFSAATCTTTVPDTLSVLIDQRRRCPNSLFYCHFAHLNVHLFEASFWAQLSIYLSLVANSLWCSSYHSHCRLVLPLQ
jgi:cellulose synthase/poly-beta-1,6-N-acetylglucosamine synthase-like glycosyltransferase